MLYLVAGLIGFAIGGLVAGQRPAPVALGLFERLALVRVRQERGRWSR